MLYGSLKNKSVWGFVAVAIFITGCFSIFFIDKPPRSIGASQDSLQMLLDSSFINIGATFSYFIGLREFGADYMLLTKLGIQIQTLFAFCYTYLRTTHYQHLKTPHSARVHAARYSMYEQSQERTACRATWHVCIAICTQAQR